MPRPIRPDPAARPLPPALEGVVSDCPWYVSAHAVRRYIEIARPSLSFDDASDELIELCAKTWTHYHAEGRHPSISRSGAYVYRTGRPFRLQLIVSPQDRPEGNKQQVVDVVCPHGQRRRR